MKHHAKFEKRGVLAMRADLWGLLFGVDTPDEDFELRGDTAIVKIEGPLTHHAEWWWDSYDAIKGRVDAALQSPASTVLLKIDSPGGDVSGCFETSKAIRDAAKAAGKKVVAYADGMAASAGYALACAADTICVPATGFVGSIGVISTLIDFVSMNEKYGINVAVVASGERKTFGHPDVPISDAAKKNTQDQVDSLADLFFALVSESRGLAVEKVAGLEAGVFHGQKAVDAGLADRVCTLDQLLEDPSGANSASQNAAPKESSMGWKDDMKKAADEGDEDAKKALEALGGDSDDKPKDEGDEASAEGDDAPPADDDDGKDKDDDGSRDAVAGPVSFDARLRAIEEREERVALLASRPDIAHDSALAKRLGSASLETVRWAVGNLPKVAAKGASAASAPPPPAARPKIQTSPLAHAGALTPEITRAAGHEGGGARAGLATRFSSRADELDAVFGTAPQGPHVIHEGNSMSIRVMTPAQARAHKKSLAARAEQAPTGGK